MSKINKAAVLNPFNELTANILNYVPRATTSEFGIVAIGSGINVDELGRIYLDTQEYSDRLSAIEAQAASALATQKSEVAAAIAQVNLTQSQTITALTLEVNNLKTDLISSVTTTQTELTNRIGQLTQDTADSIDAKQTEFNNRTNQIVQEVNDSITAIQTNFNIQTDQLIQDVTDITDQLTQDKAAFTQEIQDALVYLENAESVASALRTPRKINGTDFDGRSDITTNAWGATRTFKIGNKTNSINGTSNVTYTLADIGAFPDVGGTIQGNVEVTGNLSVGGTISATLEGNAGTATKLQTPRTINGVSFDGSANITLPLASTSVSGTVQLNNTLTSTATNQALTAAQGKALNDNKLDKTANAVSATKLQTPRTISLTGGVTGSVSFDGSANATIATTVTGLGVANGIATLDSAGLVPSNQLPSYVDDVLEYLNVAAFPSTGETGKIYVETTGNTTYRWSGTGYVKITSGEVSSVAGKTGVVTLTKSDVGLANVDNTADSAKSVATAAKLTTARTIGGVSFDGSANISLPGVNTTGNQSTSGNAATATKLQTARTIGGVSFDGTANINLPGVNTAGNQSTSGNAGSATKLATARTITVGLTGKTFDGSSDVTYTINEVLPTATSGQFLKFDGTNWVAAADNNTTYSAMSQAEADTGTATSSRVLTAAVLKGAIQTHAPVQTSVAGNAATATKLQTARAINGVSFDGTANISVPALVTTISSAVDLNTFQTAGFYACPASATAATLTNCPTAQAFSLLVEKHAGVKQTVTEYVTENSKTYSRNLYGSTWGAWYRVYTTIDPQPSVTGNAATATTLQTARTIGGVSFNGSANINLPGVNTTGNQNTTGNAASATKLQTPRTINGVNFDGTANITVADSAKLPLTGGTLSGPLRIEGAAGSNPLQVRGIQGIENGATTAGLYLNYVDQTTKTYFNGETHYIQGGTYTGNAATATQLETARTINGTSFNGTANITTANWGTARTLSFTGDVTGSASVNGSANVATAMTLANSGVTAGTYKSVTVDAKGRVTAGTAVVTGLVTTTAASGTANTATTNTNTFLNIVETVGATPSTVGTSTQITGAGTVTVTSDTAGKLTITGSQSITGNAATATKLATASTINGKSFDGTANISIEYLAAIDNRTIKPNATPKRAVTPYFTSAGGLTTSTADAVYGDLLVLNGYSDTSGGNVNAIWFGKNTQELKHYYAAQGATTWGTPKTIAYTDSSITGNAASATKLATARTINGVSFDGTANITVADSTKVPLAGGTMTGALKVNNTTASTSATTGAITTTGGVGIGGALFTTGAITSANNVTAYSDIRIKDNITVIDDALNKVNQLKGVTFNRIDTDDKDKRYVGLIAQDVQSVMPEAVNVNNDELNTLSVDYQGLVGLLVESIKELKAEIDELKEKVK